jgi:Dynamin family
VNPTFNQNFDKFSLWRRELSARLRSLAEWLKEQDLLNSSIDHRLKQLQSKVRNEKMMVAFVAEFSRGKSELINAIFFAGYGRRIMPASAGRTTMCPTELGFDEGVPPCLRLLPIETRLQSQSLMEWRLMPDQWERVDLDVNNPEQMARAMEKVSEVKVVTQSQAADLGLWHEDTPDDNPPTDANGLVEVPKWRHAQINVEHPLLKQGLVILDTPGLNAIGAEPELTMSLIPQAHAVVFILGADTGVTKSDLSIWREHLQTESGDITRLAVLNKIDTLWDPLSTPEQIQAQVARQRRTSAQALGLGEDHVLAISAHKGLVAKVTGDADLLQKSCLLDMEAALSQGVMGSREAMLKASVAAGLSELRRECEQVLMTRKRNLSEQALELRGLRGKSAGVMKQLLARIEQEHVDFQGGSARIQALRTVHLRMLKELFATLNSAALKQELTDLREAMSRPGIKVGLKKSYGDTFERLRGMLTAANSLCAEIQSMLQASYRQINTEHGFTLSVPPVPDFTKHFRDLEQLQNSHLKYLSIGNLLKLAQPYFAERLIRALVTRARMIFEAAQGEVEFWSRSAASHLDAQMRERRKLHASRVEAIEKVRDASSTLEERIAEIDKFNQRAAQIQAVLSEMTQKILDSQASMRLAA